MRKFLFLFALSTFSLLQAFDPTIPVLHLPDYHNPIKREAFLDQLDSAMKDVGFFAITGVDIEVEVLDEAYAEAKNFFSMNLQEKLKFQAKNGQRGFVQSESAKDEMRKDFKEFYHIGRELSARDLKRLHYQENLWPDKPYAFKRTMLTLFDALDGFKDILGSAISEVLGQEKNFINAMTSEGNCLMRVLYYPANPSKKEIWASAHTDIDFFTILPRCTAKGLQVQNQEGRWIDVIVPDGAFIVNCGDMLENISNGYCKSARHRVMDPGLKEERYAIVHFIHPRADDRLDPLPASLAKTGGKRLYANVTRMELLAERLIDLGLASDELMQFFVASGAIDRLKEVGRFSPKAEQALIECGHLR
ncbi:MAG: hypothetical protein K1060chlam2_00311 [Chlamydiae bacterium]|nr:hypothetical protein [Chlamydiota bacterium]